MAMVVKNNIPAKNTLNLLNRNDKALAKDLEKVSSGMRINSAADDASGYAIRVAKKMYEKKVSCPCQQSSYLV